MKHILDSLTRTEDLKDSPAVLVSGRIAVKGYLSKAAIGNVYVLHAPNPFNDNELEGQSFQLQDVANIRYIRLKEGELLHIILNPPQV